MKKELLFLSLMVGSLTVYSADQKQASPAQKEVTAATEDIAGLPRIMAEDEDEEREKKEQVFMIVEKKAEFPGGHKKLMEYLRGNIKYPEQALAKSIEGKVYVKFTVKKDGSIDDVKIIRSTDSLLDEEAIRVVKNMPKWIPGQTRGKDVNSSITLPVTFFLPDSTATNEEKK